MCLSRQLDFQKTGGTAQIFVRFLISTLKQNDKDILEKIIGRLKGEKLPRELADCTNWQFHNWGLLAK
jgi:hypothetical protein